MLTFFPWDNSKALLKTISLAFVLWFLWPGFGLLLPYLWWILCTRLIADHSLWSCSYPRQVLTVMVQQVWSAEITLVSDFQATTLKTWASLWSGSRVVRFKIVCEVIFVLYNKMAWYFPMHPTISQYPLFYFNRVRTWCDTNSIIGCPRVNFFISCEVSKVAASVWRHGGHPIVMIHFCERKVMGWRIFPRVWGSTPSLIPCLSWMFHLKCFSKSGNPSVGAETRFSFKMSSVTWQFLVHSKYSESSPFKELCNGSAISPKFGIQIWQDPEISKNPQKLPVILLDFYCSNGLFSISHSAPSAMFQLEPRYATSCLQIMPCEVIIYILFLPNVSGLWWCWASCPHKYC